MSKAYVKQSFALCRMLTCTLIVAMVTGMKNPSLSQNKSATAGAEQVGRDNMIFMVVEKQPEFPGGISARKDFFAKHLTAPKSEKKMKGIVYTSFVVNTDGTLQDVEIKESLQQEYDLEAIRVINLMPRWVSGSQSGRKVRVRYILPVEFK